MSVKLLSTSFVCSWKYDLPNTKCQLISDIVFFIYYYYYYYFSFIYDQHVGLILVPQWSNAEMH